MKTIILFLIALSLPALADSLPVIRPGMTLTKAMYEKWTTPELAEALVNSIHESREPKSNKGYDYLKDSRIIIAADSTNLWEITREGFLNQHQVGRSNGLYNPPGRAKTENEFAGIKLEKKYDQLDQAHELRPKYAFLMLDKYTEETRYKEFDQQYGDLYFKLKEEVKLRSTFSPGDSLVLAGLDFKNGGVHTFHYRNEKPLKLEWKFWEVQVWGKLTMSDVEYVLVNCPGVEEPLDDFDIGRLRKMAPVHQCLFKQDPATGQFEYLVKGNAL